MRICCNIYYSDAGQAARHLMARIAMCCGIYDSNVIDNYLNMTKMCLLLDVSGFVLNSSYTMHEV